MDDTQLAVIAIGGNSLISDPRHQSVDDQYETTRTATRHIADLIEAGYRVVITHGNGPQVGFILLRSEAAKKVIHEIPVDTAGADTQGGIGYHLQQTLGNELRRRGILRSITTVITQVLVDRNDPGFENPAKPIGVFYSADEANQLEEERGWQTVEDSGRGWRRVVPSPAPEEIIEFDAIETLVKAQCQSDKPIPESFQSLGKGLSWVAFVAAHLDLYVAFVSSFRASFRKNEEPHHLA